MEDSKNFGSDAFAQQISDMNFDGIISSIGKIKDEYGQSTINELQTNINILPNQSYLCQGCKQFPIIEFISVNLINYQCDCKDIKPGKIVNYFDTLKIEKNYIDEVSCKCINKENIYYCCMVKLTHHIRGYASTEEKKIIFIYK